jgi:dCTP deaminase
VTVDPVVGTLSDRQIIDHAARGELFAKGYSSKFVKQACYELRTSSTYYDLASPDRPISLAPGETILLKPKQLVVVITHEELALPDDILGRVLSKGQLFSLGIVPVNTYADPGFHGRLGIVLNNASNDYLALPQKEPVAKIEFVRIASSVENPYRGPHGYESAIWPIKHQFRLTPEQVATDPRIGSTLDEIALTHGRRVFGYERRVLFAAIAYMLMMTGILALSVVREDRLDIALSVGLGVVSSLLFSILLWLATNLSSRRRRR